MAIDLFLVGELKPDKKGRLRADGYTQKIVPEEAKIVKRIFKDFAEGKSINGIMKELNLENVPIQTKIKRRMEDFKHLKDS